MIQAGAASGHVRACLGASGEEVVGLPSTAVVVTGLDDVPAAGDTFSAYADEDEAREAAKVRARSVFVSHVFVGSCAGHAGCRFGAAFVSLQSKFG